MHSLAPAPAPRPRALIVRTALRALTVIVAAALRAAERWGPAPRALESGPIDVLLTGTFHSDNWVAAHLRPLAAAQTIRRVRMVSARPVPALDKVETVAPPRWLCRVIGTVPARLATFFWVGLRTRPHVVGGFHLLMNGLAAALLARLIGARAVYICVGGPGEVLDGGTRSESRLFGRLEAPDPVVERRLLEAVRSFDLVVTMGTSAARFFRDQGVEAPIHILPGAVDAARFCVSPTTPEVDLVLVGRLVPLKRIDIFVRAVARLSASLPDITAIVVGEGPLREQLEQLTRGLWLEERVRFVGQQARVEDWLRRARVFVLTSESEGLSLSLVEALRCGLPAVVSRVGDLEDVIEEGVNGYLVSDRSPDAFAERILDLVGDPARRDRFAEAAVRSTKRFDAAAQGLLWDAALEAADGRPAAKATA
jgi:glycosyltransferase involved in cell wall biosynthesis